MGKKLKRDPSHIAAVLDRYRVTSGRGFDLERYATEDLPDDMPGKHKAQHILAAGIERLSELQEILYAEARWSLLVVLQAMDAGGKDSTIKHVMSGVNPQGVTVTSFKAPEPQELAHDFLWRVHRVAPARGMIGLFNRSHYEEVLITRVHDDVLAKARLPEAVRRGGSFWDDRIADIAAFEAYLARQGTRIVKIFLNVGRDEQKERFLKRLDEPSKHWKFDPADLAERKLWGRYRTAYQAAIAGTATSAAPWYVVPADRKWYARLVVAEAIIAALEGLDLAFPQAKANAVELAEARKALARDDV